MSLKKLIALTVLDVFLAVLIGFGVVVLQAALTSPGATWGTLRALRAVGLPLDKLGLQERLDRAMTWSFAVGAQCVTLPADDAELRAWLRQQSDLRGVEVEREKLSGPLPQGETVRVVVHYDGPADTRRIDVPWEKLGYQLGSPPSVWWYRHSPDTMYTPSDPQLVLIVFACLMAGQFAVGIVRMWQNRKQEATVSGGDAPGLLAGLGVGLALAALYWGVYQAALRWGGATAALAPCWQALPISGVDMGRSGLPVFWRSVEPHPFLLAVIGMVMFLFPVASVVFIWGVFRRWTFAGRPKTGCVLAAAVAPAFLLSATAFPVAFGIVLVLVWLGHGTRSMGPPLVALIVLCAAVVGITFGAIPSLSHPVTRLPGKWREVANTVPALGVNVRRTTGNRLQFLHGGGADSDGFTNDAWHYDWTGDDTIRLIWVRKTYDNAGTTVTRDWLREDYRVTVSWEELTLTRVSDGKQLEFRRAN